MRASLTIPALLMACACGPSQAQHQSGTPGPDLAAAASELGRNLLAGHATFDGVAVTGLKPAARCEAIIMTRRGAAPIRWRDLGKFAPRLDNGRRIFRFQSEGRPHVLSVVDGRTADGVDAGLGLLDDECGGT